MLTPLLLFQAAGAAGVLALKLHDNSGAYAGIALGLQVLLASLMIPLLFRWLA